MNVLRTCISVLWITTDQSILSTFGLLDSVLGRSNEIDLILLIFRLIADISLRADSFIWSTFGFFRDILVHYFLHTTLFKTLLDGIVCLFGKNRPVFSSRYAIDLRIEVFLTVLLALLRVSSKNSLLLIGMARSLTLLDTFLVIENCSWSLRSTSILLLV